MADLGIHIEAVARELLGEPNREQSTKSQLRFGTHGSVSVEITGEKRGTWYDHEAEVGGGVLDLLREKANLSNGVALDFLRGMGIEVGAKPEAKPARRIVATYDYTDEAGKLLFQVVRYEPKDFRQRRPDGKGGWIWSVKGRRMVPFNLPAVLAADTIYVVEGEKDALNLGKLGLVATTNPGGASKPNKAGKWPADFARYFAGKNVVIIGDNDEAGRPHVEHVVKNLTGTVARVVALELPNLPYKGDVSNWIEAGGTAEDLKRLLEGVEPAEPAPNPTEPLDLGSFLNATSWLGRTLETPEPLLGEVITNTTRMFLGGPTGLGKTHVGFGMAAGMATGTGFLHWKASRPARVLYLDGEMSRDLVQERLADLQWRFGAELSNLYVLCAEDREEIAAMCPGLGEMEALNTPEGQAFVLNLIDRIGGVDVVFLDNRMSLLSGDMKEEQPWSDTMALVKELTRRRIAQVWIDHTGHDTGRIYGTKTKEWQFDTVALMEKADRPGADIAFSLKFDKARRRKPSNRTDFDMFTATLANDEWTVEGTGRAGKRGKVCAMAAAIHGALLDALVISPSPGMVTRNLLYAECVRLGLADPIYADDSRDGADRKRAKLRKYIGELKAAGWIGVNGDTVRNLVAEPLPNRAEPAPDDREAKPARSGGFPAPNPAKSAEPRKQGAEPLPNPGVPNPPNPAEPMPNFCRTSAEPSSGTLPNLPNPVSIDGFGGTAVRQSVRQAFKEADQLRQILESANQLADLSERLAQFKWLERFNPVVPDVSGARLLEKVEP
jgi:hypothetical protein